MGVSEHENEKMLRGSRVNAVKLGITRKPVPANLGEMYQAGMSTKQIAAQIGVCAGTVQNWLRKLGVELRSPIGGIRLAARQGRGGWTPSSEPVQLLSRATQAGRAARMYRSRRGIPRIARALGVSERTVRRMIVSTGTPLRIPGPPHRRAYLIDGTGSGRQRQRSVTVKSAIVRVSRRDGKELGRFIARLDWKQRIFTSSLAPDAPEGRRYWTWLRERHLRRGLIVMACPIRPFDDSAWRIPDAWRRVRRDGRIAMLRGRAKRIFDRRLNFREACAAGVPAQRPRWSNVPVWEPSFNCNDARPAA